MPVSGTIYIFLSSSQSLQRHFRRFHVWYYSWIDKLKTGRSLDAFLYRRIYDKWTYKYYVYVYTVGIFLPPTTLAS